MGITRGTALYGYDEFNRLTSYSDLKGNSAEYTYYADGLRKSKTVGEDTTEYYYNGQNVINETKNASEYATNIIGVNGYICRTQDGITGYFLRDGHGDIQTAYAEDRTTKLADYTYDAWGNQNNTEVLSWGENNPIRYAGQYYDTESDMIYLRARYYNPDIGRFINEDPAKDGLNWYSYCGNNPIMFVDPSGLINEWENINRKFPSKTSLPAPTPIYGVIWGQSTNANVKNMNFEGYPISDVGCEVVAVHNALYLSNNGQDFRSVLDKCKDIKYSPLNGYLGCNPDNIGSVLSHFGTSYTSTKGSAQFDNFVSGNGVYIISFNVGKDILNLPTGTEGVHTVAFTVSDTGWIVAYNPRGNDTNGAEFVDFNAFKQYIVGDNKINIIYKLEYTK